MSQMIKTLSIYRAYFYQFLKARLAYKWDFVASLFSGIFISLSGLIYILVLVDGKTVPELKGWSRDHILFIYGYSMIATGLFSSLSRNLYQFADRYIIQGEFDRILLRPLNSLLQVLFDSLHLEGLGTSMLGLAVVFYAGNNLGLEANFASFLWLVFSALCGASILLCVFIILASLSFHFEDRIGIAPPFYNLIHFGRYPVDIYNNIIRFVIQWIVPFSFVAFFPATYFLDVKQFLFYSYLTPVIAFLWIIFTTIMWRFGVSKYSSTGT